MGRRVIRQDELQLYPGHSSTKYIRKTRAIFVPKAPQFEVNVQRAKVLYFVAVSHILGLSMVGTIIRPRDCDVHV